MKRSTRAAVFAKYNGRCAYTGKVLNHDWQVDHMESQFKTRYDAHRECCTEEETKARIKACNAIENLMPAQRIVNHYKSNFGLEGFRQYMLKLHIRMAKLPKKTSVPRTAKRIEYLREVADLFGITVDKPFSGKFYFETLDK